MSEAVFDLQSAVAVSKVEDLFCTSLLFDHLDVCGVVLEAHLRE